jgi:hypothetical protein
MKIKILASMLAGALAMLPVTANAGWGGGGVGAYGEPITIYGWQYHSFESVEKNGGTVDERDFTEVRSNAANIGFLGFVDTGIEGLKMTWRCENFTYLGDFAGGTGWCNRNSKIGISGSFGELMMATWLLPYNEMVAQWVDPFYDAGNLSHTGIMGNIGTTSGVFYNTGLFEDQDSFGTFDYSMANFGLNGGCTKANGQCYGDIGSYGMGFNRRQEGIVQYMGATGGLSYRFAFTQGERDEKTTTGGSDTQQKVDPVIYSTGVAYTSGPMWMAVTYQKHEDWVAAGLGDTAAGDAVGTSDAESYRIAGRYIADMGNGASLTVSAMWENLEYEVNDIHTDFFQTFGFSGNVFGTVTAGTNATIDRDAWMVSGKYATGGPFNFRFMYAQADDYDVEATFISGQKNRTSDTGADMLVLGAYYSLGDSTEFGLTYNEIDNDTHGAYGTGIGGYGLGAVGSDNEIFALNVITMF